MSQKIPVSTLQLSVVLLILTMVFAWATPIAAAQNARGVSLEEQLKAQYKPVKIGTATEEITIIEPGTALATQKGGILGVVPKNLAMGPSKFEDGNLKGPNNFCVGMVGKQNTRYLTSGEKVYPFKIDVNTGKEKVTFTILERDSCNGVTEPSSYKTEVVFQFAKGYLDTASAGAVEDTIGQVLSIAGDDAKQGDAAQSADQQQRAADPPHADPQTIKLGQTTDQVQAALGKPDKIIDLGAKKIYAHKDLKVTFVNNQVADVQ
jgi:hypothetical protein